MMLLSAGLHNCWRLNRTSVILFRQLFLRCRHEAKAGDVQWGKGVLFEKKLKVES